MQLSKGKLPTADSWQRQPDHFQANTRLKISLLIVLLHRLPRYSRMRPLPSLSCARVHLRYSYIHIMPPPPIVSNPCSRSVSETPTNHFSKAGQAPNRPRPSCLRQPRKRKKGIRPIPAAQCPIPRALTGTTRREINKVHKQLHAPGSPQARRGASVAPHPAAPRPSETRRHFISNVWPAQGASFAINTASIQHPPLCPGTPVPPTTGYG